MKKTITLLGCTLLFASTQVLADRPAMSEDSDMLDLELELESIDDDSSLVVEEITPVSEAPTTVEAPVEVESEIEPVLEDISAVELEMQQEVDVIGETPVEEAAEAEPVIHVYDHNTETEISSHQTSSGATELEQGEILPVSIVDFPRRGMDMDKVRNELGEPLEISDSVGEPPITSWTYNDRIVYFEFSRVLHVVSTR